MYSIGSHLPTDCPCPGCLAAAGGPPPRHPQLLLRPLPVHQPRAVPGDCERAAQDRDDRLPGKSTHSVPAVGAQQAQQRVPYVLPSTHCAALDGRERILWLHKGVKLSGNRGASTGTVSAAALCYQGTSMFPVRLPPLQGYVTTDPRYTTQVRVFPATCCCVLYRSNVLAQQPARIPLSHPQNSIHVYQPSSALGCSRLCTKLTPDALLRAAAVEGTADGDSAPHAARDGKPRWPCIRPSYHWRYVWGCLGAADACRQPNHGVMLSSPPACAQPWPAGEGGRQSRCM